MLAVSRELVVSRNVEYAGLRCMLLDRDAGMEKKTNTSEGLGLLVGNAAVESNMKTSVLRRLSI